MARPTKTRPGVSQAAADILGQLGALAPEPTKSESKQRWTLPLTPEAKTEAGRWLAAKVILDPIKARMDNAKAEFSRYALDLIAEKLFEQGNKPSNPLVVLTKEDETTVDHEFLFQLQDKFKVKLPEAGAGESQRDCLVAKLEEIGFHPSDAAGFVDNEIDFATVTGFKSLSELLEGHYGEGREWYDSSPAEKEAGLKLAALVKWDGTEPAPQALSVEEKRLVLDLSSQVTVKAGFFSRIRNYCRTPEQVKALFMVCTPVCYPSHLKFAVADSETAKAARKVAAASEIIGTGN